MQSLVKIQLKPDKNIYNELLQTMKVINEAQDYISEQAFGNQTFNKHDLRKLLYYEVRSKYNLSAQQTILAIANVANAYKTQIANKSLKLCKFKKYSAISFDSRILSIKNNHVSIKLLQQGRSKVPYFLSDYFKENFKYKHKESKLIYRRDKNIFFLHITINKPDTNPLITKDLLGIDLGVKNIAATSNRKIYSSDKIEKVRKRYHTLRQTLQKVNTKSSKRKLKRISKKESNFRKNTNHVISKEIVKYAKDNLLDIVMEDLTNINKRATVRKAYRNERMSWSFYQLRSFITYKACNAGLQVILINPRYTSQECIMCGCIDKRNRKTQSEFCCVECKHKDHADIHASFVIRKRALKPEEAISTSLLSSDFQSFENNLNDKLHASA